MPGASTFDATAQVAELAGSSTPFPLALVVALEDAQYLQARQLLEPLLAQYPASIPLRALKVQLDSGQDVDGFLAANPPQEGRGTAALPAIAPPYKASRTFGELALADRFEAAHTRLTRVELERKFYRGDRSQPAEAFMERVSYELSSVQEALEALEQDLKSSHGEAAALARVQLSLAWSLALQRNLSSERRRALWSNLEDAGAWQAHFRFLALEARLAPQDLDGAWLVQYCARWHPDGRSKARAGATAEEALTDHVFFGRCLMASVAQESRYANLDYDQTASRYRDAFRLLEPGPLSDDVTYQLAYQLARSYRPEGRQEAVSLLRRLVDGPFHNQSYPAAYELAALLRRQGDDAGSLHVCQTWHERFPTFAYRLDREEGRALFRLERFDEAAEAFRRLIEGPRGRSGDYLLLAESLQRLQATGRYPDRDLRREGLQLADFAQKAAVQEALVVGWINGRPPQLSALYARLAELNALARHAVLFPAPFAYFGLRLFLVALVGALGVMLFASFPRLSRQSWRPALLLGLVLSLGPTYALSPLQTGGLEGLAQAGWAGQAVLQGGLLLVSSLILSYVARLPGLRLKRWWWQMRRSRSTGRADSTLSAPRGTLVEALAALILLVSLQALAKSLSLQPVPYLERFPEVLMGTELGVRLAVVPAHVALLTSVYWTAVQELLCRGFVLGATCWLLNTARNIPGKPEAPGEAHQPVLHRLLALAFSALVSALLVVGGHEPVGAAFALAFVQGLILGTLRIRQGLDVALLIALLGTALSMGPGL